MAGSVERAKAAVKQVDPTAILLEMHDAIEVTCAVDKIDAVQAALLQALLPNLGPVTCTVQGRQLPWSKTEKSP